MDCEHVGLVKTEDLSCNMVGSDILQSIHYPFHIFCPRCSPFKQHHITAGHTFYRLHGKDPMNTSQKLMCIA